jgi:putative phage-type endonuclease
MGVPYALEKHETKTSWLDARKRGIGASESPIIMGLTPWSSPLQVWRQKRGIADEIEETERMRWGTILEPIVARAFADESGRTPVNMGDMAIYWSLETPYMFATPDRRINSCAEFEGKGPGLLEVKTTGSYADLDGGPWPYWKVQVQHQLYCTGYQWASLACLAGGQRFVWFDLPRDEQFIRDRLLPVCEEFWLRVESGDAPDPVANDNDIMASLYADGGEAKALGHAEMMLTEELDEITEQIKDLEKGKRELQAMLKASLGSASVGMLPDGSGWSWKEQHRKAHMVKESYSRVLRRIKRRA